MNQSRRMRLTLPDSRSLDVYDGGPTDGQVLLFHHGTPGSGTPMRVLANAAHRRGVRFVTTSRPGYGDSTRHPGRGVVDVAGDTAAVLDAVGADRCLVAGWSGGGPHAVACGAQLAERVDGVLIIAGVGPYGAEGLDFLDGMGEDNLVEFGKSLEGETALRPYLDEQRDQLLQATPAVMVEVMSSLLPAADRAVVTEEFGEDLAAQIHEAIRVGVDGWLDDDLAFTKPWGFALAEVTVPAFLWQGSEDRMVPFAHAGWLAGQIPGVVPHLEEGEGHLSITIGAIDRMLDELLAVTAARSR